MVTHTRCGVVVLLKSVPVTKVTSYTNPINPCIVALVTVYTAVTVFAGDSDSVIVLPIGKPVFGCTAPLAKPKNIWVIALVNPVPFPITLTPTSDEEKEAAFNGVCEI